MKTITWNKTAHAAADVHEANITLWMEGPDGEKLAGQNLSKRITMIATSDGDWGIIESISAGRGSRREKIEGKVSDLAGAKSAATAALRGFIAGLRIHGSGFGPNGQPKLNRVKAYSDSVNGVLGEIPR